MSKFKQALDKYAKYVIQQSKSNLTKKGSKASGRLYKSLGYKIEVYVESIGQSLDEYLVNPDYFEEILNYLENISIIKLSKIRVLQKIQDFKSKFFK